MSQIVVLYIPADEDVPVQLRRIPNTLAAKQELVGGNIEVIDPFPGEVAITGYACEDVYDSTPPNIIATALLRRTWGTAHIGIRGPYFICGFDRNRGVDRSITPYALGLSRLTWIKLGAVA
jgi:hypothetical protein